MLHYRDVTVKEFLNLLHTISIRISHLVALMHLQSCLSVVMLVSHQKNICPLRRYCLF